MTYRFSSIAKIELSQIAFWHEDRQEGLGDMVYDEVERTINRILRAPEAYTHFGPEMRRINASRFRLSLIYRVFDDHISIASVFDAGQNPENWQDILNNR